MIFAQLVGILALSFIILSYQQNDRRLILFYLMIAQLIWSVHFGLIGAWTAAVTNIIAAGRSYSYTKDWTKHSLTPLLFIALFVLTAPLTWTGPASLLPILAQSVATFSYWMREPRRIRYLTLIPRPLWTTYHLLVGSYAGIIAELFMSTALITSILRFDILKRPEPVIED